MTETNSKFLERYGKARERLMQEKYGHIDRINSTVERIWEIVTREQMRKEDEEFDREVFAMMEKMDQEEKESQNSKN
ncbi:hypothetical protein JXA32_01520 [Candidatus Sumerlaeota bacterium]|nr:hypothetical protein [Candidatus Sumerlaeota bacterium]